jgi:hypothetical protein
MSRAPTTFRQRDVTAAVKAVTAAGYEVLRVEVDKQGRITVVTTKGTLEPVGEGNYFDEKLKHGEDRDPEPSPV